MALTRSFLRGMGLEDDKVSAIIEAHSESIDALKEQRDKYKEDADKLTAVQSELDKLKADGGDWKTKYEKEHSDYEAYKTAQTAKETRSAKEAAYRDILKEVGVGEKRFDVVLRATDFDSLELDDKGAFKNRKELVDKAKADWSDFIVQTGTQGASVPKPPAGGGTVTKESIMAITDRNERRKAIAENRDLFK